jgi:hypothetical protein
MRLATHLTEFEVLTLLAGEFYYLGCNALKFGKSEPMLLLACLLAWLALKP